LPAEIVAARVAPRGAAVALVAGEEIEEQAGLVERPAPLRVAAEDVAEQFLGAPPVEEMLLVGGALVGIARRHGDAVDAELADRVEERRDPRRVGRVEQGGVDVDPEAARLGEADRRDGAVVDPVLADRAVVILAVAVEMHRPGEIAVGPEQIDLLFQQQRVGAQIDEFLARDDAGDDVLDLAVQQGSPPASTTTGAPHSSTAARHSATLSRWLRIGSG